MLETIYKPLLTAALEPGLCHQEATGLDGQMALPWREKVREEVDGTCLAREFMGEVLR